MYVKFTPGDLNPGPCPYTSQALILVQWSSHQRYAVVDQLIKIECVKQWQ